MQIAALNKPNFKTLTGLLISGLLVKIALSTAFLAPCPRPVLKWPPLQRGRHRRRRCQSGAQRRACPG